jgi:cyclopropane fatty-acyl-phospholipid synthase-like methyltransferase
MNWIAFWQQQGKHPQPLDQVGRLGGTFVQQDDFLKAYAVYIAELLQLNNEDVLLDVCCGNGLLTRHLAPYCKQVVGVDFSEKHISYARGHFASSNLVFYCGNALELSDMEELSSYTFTKSTLCFSFQYFESIEQGLNVLIQQCKLLPPKATILLTDIPDSDRWFRYYNTPLKMLRLFKQMVLQRNDMGKFWSERELGYICEKLNVKGFKLNQPSTFPYANYRMDYLIMKNQNA